MKRTKKFLSILLTVAMVFGMFTIAIPSATADDGKIQAPKASSIILRGDADNGGSVNIADVTKIQKYLAHIDDLTETQKVAADVNGSGTVEIADATEIQKFLAQMGNPYDIGGQISADITTAPEDTTVTEPETTVPEDTTVTEPDTTVPEDTTVTEPDTTVPEDTTVTEPETTVPEDTTVTEPETTVTEDTTVTDPYIPSEDITVYLENKYEWAPAAIYYWGEGIEAGTIEMAATGASGENGALWSAVISGELLDSIEGILFRNEYESAKDKWEDYYKSEDIAVGDLSDSIAF
ncbi:MAG: dockerin type I repeat-containing protein, partial [Oscillospiraceae bacterium]|nr:dockerin type I repeat-containing protein [Oscillospiraceae bacterium]